MSHHRSVCNRLILLLGFLVASPWSLADTYRLAINENTIDLIGQPQTAILANDGLPAPTLHWREGENVTLEVTNNLKEQTSIHWHGIVLPYDMDGVPGISFDGIAPGQTFSYRFPIKQSGTYWYHGHSGMQEQQGLFGAIVIDPAAETLHADRDYIVMLSDWPAADPHRTLARLKKQNDEELAKLDKPSGISGENGQKRKMSLFKSDKVGSSKT